MVMSILLLIVYIGLLTTFCIISQFTDCYACNDYILWKNTRDMSRVKHKNLGFSLSFCPFLNSLIHSWHSSLDWFFDLFLTHLNPSALEACTLESWHKWFERYFFENVVVKSLIVLIKLWGILVKFWDVLAKIDWCSSHILLF